ncbi:unnamed protein product [Medioppia subpectinata]|uniref:Uncharacterized protein n=1 Tax=Medioppia subpectinata TaxID=1979941 RepID=A0A7R9QF88_9ACAR|nr:unnamed protein product [Medioppia subpectinata]CAG2119698.1 unnamed protein product [Medioppia subpectinata]
MVCTRWSPINHLMIIIMRPNYRNIQTYIDPNSIVWFSHIFSPSLNIIRGTLITT